MKKRRRGKKLKLKRRVNANLIHHGLKPIDFQINTICIMKFFIFLLCATLVAGTAPFVNYTAPTNLRAEANINAIALFWEHEDENAVFLVRTW